MKKKKYSTKENDQSKVEEPAIVYQAINNNEVLAFEKECEDGLSSVEFKREALKAVERAYERYKNNL